ncbi:hypothetical protein PG985_007783 [Apiospora marii]|uniref:Uncharacterized protein n=1 Tax=Apiospora marii TaxID=335849 RepID=A0ABR1SQ41_9PEZI
MSIKTIIRVAAIGALAAMPAAAPAGRDEEVNFTAWSSGDCGTDKSKAFDEMSTEITAWKTTAHPIKCTKNSGEQLPAALPLHEGQLGCAAVSLPHKYDLAYCCGPDCVGPLPSEKKREAATDELSAVLFNATGTSLPLPVDHLREKKEKREACSFNRTPKGLRKIFRKPRKTSPTVDCQSDASTDCSISGVYTTGNTIGDSRSDSDEFSAGAAWFVEASISHSEGTSHEISREESYSRQYTLSVAPGSSGYLIFTPQYTCGEGKFEGSDCDQAAVKAGNREWCVPSLIKGENGTMPDGKWSVLKTN